MYQTLSGVVPVSGTERGEAMGEYVRAITQLDIALKHFLVLCGMKEEHAEKITDGELDRISTIRRLAEKNPQDAWEEFLKRQETGR